MMLLVWGFWWIPSLGNVIAFQDYKPYAGGIFGSRLVGFTHFQMLFSDPEFMRAHGEHAVDHRVPAGVLLPGADHAGAAAAFAASARLRSMLQSVVYLPYFFSWVLVIAIFQQMLGGAGLLSQTCAPTGSRAWTG